MTKLSTHEWIVVHGPRSSRLSPPAVRVCLAMRRLSRSRFIPPWDVSRISLAFARRAAAWTATAQVLKAAVPAECEYVGMLNGQPPVDRFDRRFSSVIRAFHPATKKAKRRAMEMPLPEVLLVEALAKGR